MPDTRSQSVHYRKSRWVYAPMIAALTVGAVASGAGIGSADTNPDGVGAEYSQPAFKYPWRVHNFTGQTLTAGEFHRDQGADTGSALAFGGDTPWPALQPGDVTAWAFQPLGAAKTHTWGRVCYLGQVWNMPRVETLASDPGWDDMYVFAMGPESGRRLMVTTEGGHRDVDMNAYGETC